MDALHITDNEILAVLFGYTVSIPGTKGVTIFCLNADPATMERHPYEFALVMHGSGNVLGVGTCDEANLRLITIV